MLSIEEKAKAYDIALDKIKRLLGTGNNCSREDLEYVFPELKENEGERIRKALISFLKSPFVNESITDEKVTPWIAWLEKQGKQKYTKKDIDDAYFKGICDAKRELEKQCEQKPAEWSEEDYNEIETIACHLDNINNEGMAEVLRNIRDKYYHIPQNTWKPSDEQMKCLDNVKGSDDHNGYVLNTLYNDLKKLREE